MLEQQQPLTETQLEAFVAQIHAAAGKNLVSVVLYGSAASQDFHAQFSDINLLCVVNDASTAALLALASAFKGWTNLTPLIFTRAEIDASAEIFPIEMMDIRDRHHVLFGEDVFNQLTIPADRQRFQLEHELRTKLLLLRQHFLGSVSDDEKIRSLMLDSVSNFIVLFRHVLMVMGEEPAATKRQVVEQLVHKVQFDPSPFLELLQVREKKAAVNTIDVKLAFPRFLQGIERVIEALDGV